MGYSEVDIMPDFALQLIGFNRRDHITKGTWHV